MSSSQSIGFKRVKGGVCLSFISNENTNETGDTSSNSSGNIDPSSLVKRQRYEKNISASKFKGPIQKLFQKELTKTDVGKCNRLNLPKMSVLEYFPDISEGEVEKRRNVNDKELVFYDMSMRLWKFRYVFWRTSGIYAFTRGWPQFVKEKGLQPKDTITFSLCQNDTSSFLVIDVHYFDQRLENNIEIPRPSFVNEESGRCSVETAAVDSASRGNRGFRLFGVQIN